MHMQGRDRGRYKGRQRAAALGPCVLALAATSACMTGAAEGPASPDVRQDVAPEGISVSGVSALIGPCTTGGQTFEEHLAGFKAFGLRPAPSGSALWVEAQVAHIAMSDLGAPGSEGGAILETYENFRDQARDGTLFREDIQEQSYEPPSGDVVINFSIVDGSPGCSIAYGKGATSFPIDLPTRQTWTSEAGSYTRYRAGAGLNAAGSVLGSSWDSWIGPGRLAAGFFVVSG